MNFDEAGIEATEVVIRRSLVRAQVEELRSSIWALSWGDGRYGSRTFDIGANAAVNLGRNADEASTAGTTTGTASSAAVSAAVRE